MLSILAAAATAIVPAPAPAEGEAVEGVEITVTRPVTGTLEQGTQAYKPEFFTPVRPATAMDMIKWLPGFNFEDVRDLRGLGGAIGNVLIDGKPPTSKTDTLATILARIPSDQVERVDIIVGGAPGIDMRGREVIANVVMKRTAKVRGAVTVTNTAYKDGRQTPQLLVTASRNSGGTSWDASFNADQRVFPNWGSGPWVRTDGVGRELFRADQQGRGGGPAFVGTGAYEFPVAGGKLKLNGSGRWYRASVDDVATLLGSGARYTQDIVDIYRQGELGARYERAFGRTSLETQLLQRTTDHDQTSATRRPPVNNDLVVTDLVNERIARATLRFKRSETFTLEGSAEGSSNTIDTTNTLAVAGVPTFLPAADVRVHEDRGELGALASLKPSSKLGLTVAMKLEASELTASRDVQLNRSLTFWKPRMVLSWSPAKQTQVRLRAEREVGQINFYNYVAGADFRSGVILGGNPSLQPQRSWVGEATVEQQMWSGASAVLTLRHKAINDVLDTRFVPGTTAVVYGNIGDGRQTELAATLTLPLKRFGLTGAMLKGTVTRNWTRVTDPTTGERRPIPVSSVWPKLSGELHFTYDLPKQKLNLGFDYFYYSGFTFYRPTVLDRTSAQPRLNLFVEYRIKPDFTVRAEALNVADLTVRYSTGNYGGARNIAPLLYTDDRTLGIGPSFMLRVRRSFN